MNPDKAQGNLSDGGMAATTGSFVDEKQISQTRSDEKNINSKSSFWESLSTEEQALSSGEAVQRESNCGRREQSFDTVAKAAESFSGGDDVRQAEPEKAPADSAEASPSVSVELSKRSVVDKCALSGSESTGKTVIAVGAIKTNPEDKVVITTTRDKCRYASAFVQFVCSSPFEAGALFQQRNCVWCGLWQYLYWLINNYFRCKLDD